jgi:ABC-type Co2+ transport system permease subunit
MMGLWTRSGLSVEEAIISVGVVDWLDSKP